MVAIHGLASVGPSRAALQNGPHRALRDTMRREIGQSQSENDPHPDPY
jgi:hypothetical protein